MRMPTTTAAPAAAPYGEHPWVLVTGDEDDTTRRTVDWFTSRGYEIYVCAGPDRGHSCPVLDGGACPVADHTPVVANCLDLRRPEVDVLLRTLASRHPDLQIIDVPSS